MNQPINKQTADARHRDASHQILQHRYEMLSALNDLLIAIWFLVGSFFFLSDSLVEKGTWLFILGSAQLFIKPTIKLAGIMHIKRARQQNKNNGE